MLTFKTFRSEIFAGALVATITGCSGSSESSGDPTSPVPTKLVVSQFTDDVVLPTYQNLAKRSEALSDAIEALRLDPTQTNFESARAAWVAAREPWEQSEAFLFGPVHSFGYDPALDSWPLDEGGLQQAVSIYGDDVNLDLKNIDPSLKGFHAIEYILFGQNRQTTLEQLKPKDLSYLCALAKDHKKITQSILDSWSSKIEGTLAFAESLKNAGHQDNDLYPSERGALQELLEGMVGIADEVGNNKIGQPFLQADPNLVESQFSFNSLEDFQNNILSVRNVYFGSIDGSVSIDSISTYTAALDPQLDSRIKASIDLCLQKLQAIPSPFRSSILDKKARPSIEAAQAALQELRQILDMDLRRILKL